MNRLKILVAPDKFRPKLSAEKVCSIFYKQLSHKYDVKCVPLADGGEGSL